MSCTVYTREGTYVSILDFLEKWKRKLNQQTNFDDEEQPIANDVKKVIEFLKKNTDAKNSDKETIITSDITVHDIIQALQTLKTEIEKCNKERKKYNQKNNLD